MVPSRPTNAFVLGLAGGVLILVSGLFFFLLSPFFFGLFGVLSIVFGIIVIVGSVLLYRFPSQRIAWGVVVLIFSISSIIGFGGFIAGLVLGTVGGALAIAWKPESERGQQAYAMGPYGMPVMPWRICMGCGRYIPWSFNVCPLCGTQVPIAPWVPKVDEPAAAGGLAGAYAVPPPGVAPGQETIKAPCPTCEGEAEWRAQAKRWFCPAESKYF